MSNPKLSVLPISEREVLLNQCTTVLLSTTAPNTCDTPNLSAKIQMTAVVLPVFLAKAIFFSES